MTIVLPRPATFQQDVFYSNTRLLFPPLYFAVAEDLPAYLQRARYLGSVDVVGMVTL